MDCRILTFPHFHYLSLRHSSPTWRNHSTGYISRQYKPGVGRWWWSNTAYPHYDKYAGRRCCYCPVRSGSGRPIFCARLVAEKTTTTTKKKTIFHLLSCVCLPVQPLSLPSEYFLFSYSSGNHSDEWDPSEPTLQKRELRLLKNREAARECRRKKKEYIKCLENRVAVLENQNKALIEELKSLKELYCSQKADWKNHVHERPPIRCEEIPGALYLFYFPLSFALFPFRSLISLYPNPFLLVPWFLFCVVTTGTCLYVSSSRHL